MNSFQGPAACLIKICLYITSCTRASNFSRRNSIIFNKKIHNLKLNKREKFYVLMLDAG